MAKTTAIAWTRSTFNPWIGCTKVSTGCDHCYAEALDKRHRWGGAEHWGPGVPRYRTKPALWSGPLRWDHLAAEERVSGKIETKEAWHTPGFWPVFCASLADVFDNEVPREYRADLWATIEQTPNLTWLLLTKRVGNVGQMIPDRWSVEIPGNVWIGASIVNQDEADRDLQKLLRLKMKGKRFVSYEPALGPVDFSHYLFRRTPKIDWIIVGGESGAKARPFDVAWARDTVLQCRAAGVAPFVKQMGSNATTDHRTRPIGETYYWTKLLKDRSGSDPSEWPEDLRVQEFPL